MQEIATVRQCPWFGAALPKTDETATADGLRLFLRLIPSVHERAGAPHRDGSALQSRVHEPPQGGAGSRHCRPNVLAHAPGGGFIVRYGYKNSRSRSLDGYRLCSPGRCIGRAWANSSRHESPDGSDRGRVDSMGDRPLGCRRSAVAVCHRKSFLRLRSLRAVRRGRPSRGGAGEGVRRRGPLGAGAEAAADRQSVRSMRLCLAASIGRITRLISSMKLGPNMPRGF
jgi:hypothetical protein